MMIMIVRDLWAVGTPGTIHVLRRIAIHARGQITTKSRKLA